MASTIIYTLNDGQNITAKELAVKLNITPSAARYRLRKTKDASLIFKTSIELISSDAKVWVLNDGISGTVRYLSQISGLKENTLRQRLLISTDPEFVLKPPVFEMLNANIYTLSDGSETSVQELATQMKVSSSQAHSILKDISISVRQHRKTYFLSDGQVVTLNDVINITGLSKSAAKKRLNKSKDVAIVLKPHRIKSKQIESKSEQESYPNKFNLIQASIGDKYRLQECGKTGKLIRVAI